MAKRFKKFLKQGLFDSLQRQQAIQEAPLFGTLDQRNLLASMLGLLGNRSAMQFQGLGLGNTIGGTQDRLLNFQEGQTGQESDLLARFMQIIMEGKFQGESGLFGNLLGAREQQLGQGRFRDQLSAQNAGNPSQLFCQLAGLGGQLAFNQFRKPLQINFRDPQT